MPIKDIENVKTTQRHQHRFSGLFADNFTQRTLPDCLPSYFWNYFFALVIFGVKFELWHLYQRRIQNLVKYLKWKF